MTALIAISHAALQQKKHTWSLCNKITHSPRCSSHDVRGLLVALCALKLFLLSWKQTELRISNKTNGCFCEPISSILKTSSFLWALFFPFVFQIPEVIMLREEEPRKRLKDQLLSMKVGVKPCSRASQLLFFFFSVYENANHKIKVFVVNELQVLK